MQKLLKIINEVIVMGKYHSKGTIDPNGKKNELMPIKSEGMMIDDGQIKLDKSIKIQGIESKL